MNKVIRHVEYGNLIRAHYTKEGDREGTDSGFVNFARGDINLPPVGAAIKLPSDAKPATTEGADVSSGEGSIG